MMPAPKSLFQKLGFKSQSTSPLNEEGNRPEWKVQQQKEFKKWQKNMWAQISVFKKILWLSTSFCWNPGFSLQGQEQILYFVFHRVLQAKKWKGVVGVVAIGWFWKRFWCFRWNLISQLFELKRKFLVKRRELLYHILINCRSKERTILIVRLGWKMR